MRRRIAVIAALLVTMPVLAASVAASTQTVGSPQSCSQAKLTVWENDNFSGDGLVVCFVNLPDLSQVQFFGTNGCAGGNSSNWDNCISSAKFEEFSANTTVCLYTLVNYNGLLWRGVNTGDTVNWHWWNGENDQASSIKFGC